MLVISRRIGESFVIGDDMEVTVVDITGEKVVLGVVAPREVPVSRTDAAQQRADKSAINQKGYGRKQKSKLSGEADSGR